MIVSRILKVSFLILFMTGLVIMPISAKNKDNTPVKGLRKTATNDVYHPMLINNIFNYYSNNGDGSFNNFSSTSEGFEFPKGDNLATCIFEDGIVWGCHQGGQLKVGGSTYWHGLQAGPIITPGTATTDPVADDPSNPANRLFRVRPDLKPISGVTDPDDPAAAGELAIVQNSEVPLIGRYESGIKAEAILAQYWADWNEWPAALGAPFIDVKGNGVYDPTVDIPGVPQADQTMWYVANDLDKVRVNTLAGSTPIGLEMQKTIWAYNLNGALANTIFASTKIINKSGKELDSMYVAQWTDPDLGDANDDFAGCDTIRSLGYIYNGEATDANFAAYNLVVPAAGFDFFQGPIVQGAATDTAIFDLKYRPGFKNLPMTAFNYFINGNATYADPANASYSGTISWYNLLRGLVGTTGAQYINPITKLPTPFVLSGDPVAGTGWIDENMGDRRECLCSGPFKMVPGVSDTQEVVVANIAARGADYLSSVTQLKAADDFAQNIYNRLFSFPTAPAQPKLQIVALDGKVVLNWGDPVAATATESQNANGYTFEGYNIWQCPTNSSGGAKLLATYDVVDSVAVIWDNVYDPALGAKIYKPVQFGTNSGLVRTYQITKDAVKGGGLINDRNYYFAVTAYNFNPTPTLLGASLENAITPVTVVPQATLPGVVYTQKYGDTLVVAHGSGVSDGTVLVTVIDPSALTGDNYKVTFDASGLWSLIDVTKGTTLLTKQAQSATGSVPGGFVVDGMQVTAFGPPPGMKEFLIPSGTRRFSPVGGYTGLGLEGFSSAGDPTAYDPTAGTIGMAGSFLFGGIGTTLTTSQYHTVLLKMAPVPDPVTLWDPKATPTDANYSKAYRYLRHAATSYGVADPSFAPWIINTVGTYPYQDFNYAVPFSAWDMDVTPPMRLAVGCFENNATGASVDGRYWPPLTTGDNTVNREFCFIWSKPYSTTPDPTLQIDIYANTSTPMMWIMTCNRRNDPPYLSGDAANGDQFEIVANHPNVAADVFTFTSVAGAVSSSQALSDVAKINVFPNPYLGFNKLEPSNYVRFVTFTHLPQKATIRIYNLAGILVRTIVKNDKGQLTTWDLQNESGFPVASGMYVAYIDLPDIGTTKTLKLGIIQEQEFLHHF